MEFVVPLFKYLKKSELIKIHVNLEFPLAKITMFFNCLQIAMSLRLLGVMLF